jgi:CheY-like chemotaxis protein
VASAVKRRILVVDDEIALAELVRTWARGQGYNVAMVHSAEDALTLLAVRPFDVLLTDIVMPGELDGIGLAEEAHVRYPALKILLMSGYSNETSTNRGDIPWPLLVKPFTQEVLFAALAQAIQAP